MSEDHETTVPTTDQTEAVEGLEARLLQIEQQPLGDRAAAFGEVHDELRDVLEGAAADGPEGS
ncbi:hypothetical protein [Frigoribacterium sp. CFBP9030]|uniref:hypothetical protein n=1 Tax=Frigoribacterium sp. CFBP9030 TaxID=3096537 RepID=UPI002A6B7AAB|nr:hypothetical protein [Frigoribacterium sp. CFBP9030]MDY0893196.1 hypothetical protein [Frigoribacterium sp. CFBP9030]